MREHVSAAGRPAGGHLIDLWDYRGRRTGAHKARPLEPDETRGEVLLFTGVFYQRTGEDGAPVRKNGSAFGFSRRHKV